jgi:hypothetical protein
MRMSMNTRFSGSAAIEHGMKDKAAEFQHSGAEIYSKS